MALQQTIKLIDNFGEEITFRNAYIKVDFVSGTKDNVTASIDNYKTKDGVLLSKTSVSFIPSMTGENYIKQAYDCLKSLPEYANSVDC